MNVHVSILIGCVAGGAVLFSCENDKEKGERLAKINCSSCHQFTEPSLLNKKTWKKSVLPEMAFRMGLRSKGASEKSFEELTAALEVMPQKSLVSEEEFRLISDYFLANAPDSLLIPSAQKTNLLSQFEGKQIQLTMPLPMISMVKIYQDQVFVGTRGKSLLVLNNDFSIKKNFQLKSTPSDLLLSNNKILISEMGIMDPNDKTKGSIVELGFENNSKEIIGSLKRPVDFELSDFNKDGIDDIIVCAFGNYSGKIEIQEGLPNKRFKSHVLEPSPGSRKINIRDVNGDGLQDVLALLTQGDERINLYLNKGNFEFNTITLLRFPIVYGSSYFELNDFNKDGHFDILYTNGDNSDYSTILKPYHGVRIFLNNGQQQFSESWFYPMNGASMAMANDFDQDGDLDIAAIAFFPDFERSPENGFLYFENQNGTFKSFTSPLSTSGRWLVMDAGDVDQDGDTDLILGALDFKPAQKSNFEE
jgi:hypothetical protein